MFNNIGRKIKTLAQVICGIGIITSLIVGLIVILLGEGSAPIIGLLIIIFGPFVSWVSSFMTYGFGQLVENSDILVAATYDDTSTDEFADDEWETN